MTITTQAVESCPFCGTDSIFDNIDVESNGYVVKCQHCGEEIMLCDECMHADDNIDQKCDWHICFNRVGTKARGICSRGITHHERGAI